MKIRLHRAWPDGPADRAQPAAGAAQTLVVNDRDDR